MTRTMVAGNEARTGGDHRYTAHGDEASTSATGTPVFY